MPTPASAVAAVLASANAAASAASLRATEVEESRQRRNRFMAALGATALVLSAAGVWVLNRPRPTDAPATPAIGMPADSLPATSMTTSPPSAPTTAPVSPAVAGKGGTGASSASAATRQGSGAAAPTAEAPVTNPVPPARGATAAGLFYRSAETDTIDAILNPMRNDLSDTDIRRAISLLRTLMGRLPTAADSARAYLRLFEAHGLVNENVQACAALRQANEQAQTSKQAEQVTRYNNGKRCW